MLVQISAAHEEGVPSAEIVERLIFNRSSDNYTRRSLPSSHQATAQSKPGPNCRFKNQPLLFIPGRFQHMRLENSPSRQCMPRNQSRHRFQSAVEDAPIQIACGEIERPGVGLYAQESLLKRDPLAGRPRLHLPPKLRRAHVVTFNGTTFVVGDRGPTSRSVRRTNASPWSAI